ncbi:MAG: hypothetical protein K0S32_3839 [Bacteroidetes bacterium]|jgi:DNA repair exonuclease SbcCD ATPase subunit|nr:hypothetical protein [Bacteroidota bacterium]
MKRTSKIVVVTASLVLLSSGAYFWKEHEEEQQLSFNTRITAMMNERDSTESGMMITLDEIDRKLDSIRDKRGYLIIGKGSNYDEVPSKKDQILNNIAMLDNIISDNTIKIQDLQARLDKMNSRNFALRKKLEAYNKRNEDILAELESLKEQLADEKEKLFDEQEKNIVLTKQVEEQNASYTTLKKIYDKVESDAYTAYYITGSKKQLSDMNVIEQKKVPVLNIAYAKKAATYFPSNEFEKIDVREEAIIPTHTKKPVLVTSHSKDSYVWMEDEDGMKNLCITNPEVFWQSSKYLVVQTK